MPTYTYSHLEGLSVSPAPPDVPAYSEGAILFEDEVSTSPPPPASVIPPAVVVTNWTLDIDELVIHPRDELNAPLVWLSLGMQRMRKGPAC